MADFITLEKFNAIDGLVHGFGTAFTNDAVGGFDKSDSLEQIEDKKNLTLEFSKKRAVELSGKGFESVLTILQCQRENLLVVRNDMDEKYLPPADTIRCDGIITDKPGILLGIKTADCLPVLICDPIKKVAGAVHAGWMGSYKRILIKAVKRMQKEFGCNPENIMLAMGPSARACCYEVGEEFLERFDSHKDEIIIKKNGKLYFDNIKYNRLQAKALGIDENNISITENCTMCDSEENFYSYRKHGEHCGRMLSYIGFRNK